MATKVTGNKNTTSSRATAAMRAPKTKNQGRAKSGRNRMMAKVQNPENTPSRKSLEKENRKLHALVAKLTAHSNREKAKKVYLDEKALAERWGVSVKHIRTLRYRGPGPEVTYFGRSVRYRLRHIVAFERSHTFLSCTAMEQSKTRRS